MEVSEVCAEKIVVLLLDRWFFLEQNRQSWDPNIPEMWLLELVELQM